MNGEIEKLVAIVLHFRTPEKTMACLRSVVMEGVKHIVMIDNSADGGRSLIEMSDGLRSIRSAGVRMDVLSPMQNLGFASGVDFALEQVLKESYLCALVINSDATLERGSLSEMLRVIGPSEIVVPRVIQGEAGVNPCAGFFYYSKLFGVITRVRFPFFTKHAGGICLLFPRQCIRPDLLDRDFFFYGDDVMLSHDLYRRGLTFIDCSGAVVRHVGSASAGNGSMFYEYHMNRAHWLLARKLAGNTLERMLFTVARCFTLPLRASLRAVRFRSLVAWRGLLLASWDVLHSRCRTLTPPP